MPSDPKDERRPAGVFDSLVHGKPRGTETHGGATLELVGGVPLQARSCLGPDGVTDAERVDRQGSFDIWARQLPNGLWRRGRLEIEPGIEIRFIDEPRRDGATAKPRVPDLALDLQASDVIRDKVRSEIYATLLYVALCNTKWAKDGVLWDSGWRGAGDIVADLRGGGEDYLTWYCDGREGKVDEEIVADLAELGWTLSLEKDVGV